MKSAKIFHKVALIILLQFAFCGSAVYAETVEQRFYPQEFSLLGTQDDWQEIDYTQSFAGTPRHESRHFAMSDGSASKARQTTPRRHSSWDDLSTWHKYLGYGTVLMAGVTAATNSQESFHESAAYVTAAGALSTLLTGYLAHGHRFDMSQGLFSRDNLHIALGTLGAVVLTTAVAIADDGEEGSHSGLGVAGGVMMTLGVIDIKW